MMTIFHNCRFALNRHGGSTTRASFFSCYRGFAARAGLTLSPPAFAPNR
jgi:hypothetical protein